jgi:Protein of unknown function (DUF402)
LSWDRGRVVVRRDVWRGRPWVGVAALVVQDDPDLLVIYVPEGAEISVIDDGGPIVHPWSDRRAWEGHGIVVLHRPGDAYSVNVFWEGPTREFSVWYLNLEAPFVRTALGVDTRDHELDLWSTDGHSWHWKDAELLDQRVADGVYTAEEATAIRAEGERLYGEVSNGGGWWDERWAAWEPPSDWEPPRLPSGWDRVRA